ncbi:hypothetical protein GCM10027614_27560 [Micromonospora vulcania]
MAQPRVLDTAALARRVLTRDEVPNRKLGTLAAYFRTAVQPTHRALDDAKATVDVLHGLIARLGGHRVDTVGEAIEFARAVTPTQRRKKHLAEGLPKAPGSTSSGPPTTGRSTSARPATSPPGCAATSPPARSAPGSPRCWRRPSGSRRSSARTRWRRRSASCG